MTVDEQMRPGGGRREMRLPGSVAEVVASTAGPQVGAFFDLDGTLVAGFTASVHSKDRWRRREVKGAEFLRMLQLAFAYQLGRADFEQLIEEGAKTVKGRSIDELDELGQRLFEQQIADLIYPEMREIVRAHQQRGHVVALSSSAMAMQVEPVARYLGIDHVLCNRFATDDDGVIIGELERPILWGTGKADAVQRFAGENVINLKDSYFYADGDEDAALMHLVGHPRPTNPGKKLARIAERRGWPVLRFRSRGARSMLRNPRALAGVGTLLPVGAAALGVGVVTRNKRKGVDFLTRTWPGAMLALNGVSVRATGEENLTAQRPAMFIFNHRNNFDVFIVASLVKDRFTGVGKKEIQSDLILGTIGKLLDAAFIDRADSESAVAALQPIEELARRGLSVIMAPEGTRLDTPDVGPFKKGPFRIAMAAGIPIVPIVIRNAETIAGRNSSALNPGTVDVAILPPIPVDDWTLDSLGERIEEVRQLYRETLAAWPYEQDPD